MTTYRYSIEPADELGVLLSEADSPWAKGTGYFPNADMAQAHLSDTLGCDLQWEYDTSTSTWNTEVSF